MLIFVEYFQPALEEFSHTHKQNTLLILGLKVSACSLGMQHLGS